MSAFYNANFLEESMSYLERTAKKLLPILEEVKKRMIPERKKGADKANKKKKVETLDTGNDDLSDNDESWLYNANGD